MRQALELALDWIEKQPEETPESKYDVDTRYVVLRELEAALAQPEQEPLTENGMYRLGYHNGYGFGEAYGKANAPQRTWVRLTDEEIKAMDAGLSSNSSFYAGALWAEAKLKEKNGI